MGKIGLLILIIVIFVVLMWIMRSPDSPRPRQTHEQRPSGTQRRISRQHSDDSHKDELEKLQKSQFFWGVEIRQGRCEAATRVMSQQFTFDEAPALPLEGCTATVCTCRYIGLKERRSDQERRQQADRRQSTRLDPHHPDRRSLKNRRKVKDIWQDRDS